MSKTYTKSIIIASIAELAQIAKQQYRVAKLKLYNSLHGQDSSVMYSLESFMFECVTCEQKYTLYSMIDSVLANSNVNNSLSDGMTISEVSDVVKKHLWYIITENALSTRSSQSSSPLTNVITSMKADIETQLFLKVSMSSFEGELKSVADRRQQVTS